MYSKAFSQLSTVATVLTACGIETMFQVSHVGELLQLQQYLPLAVLKLYVANGDYAFGIVLQQYLPLAVLKLFVITTFHEFGRCNSTYRLRY